LKGLDERRRRGYRRQQAGFAMWRLNAIEHASP
jgi:hypothetical protein